MEISDVVSVDLLSEEDATELLVLASSFSRLAEEVPDVLDTCFMRSIMAEVAESVIVV